MTQMSYKNILDFWFKENSSNWFVKNKDLDKSIHDKFFSIYNELSHKDMPWEENPHSILASIIVLDQFPRNMFRGTKESFATDHKALECAKKAILRGYDKELRPLEKLFLYLPFEHSESMEDQKDSLKFFSKLQEEHPGNELFLDYAIQHYNIVKRFGRFPHRNKILGRTSTPEEIEFLKEEGSSF